MCPTVRAIFLYLPLLNPYPATPCVTYRFTQRYRQPTFLNRHSVQSDQTFSHRCYPGSPIGVQTPMNYTPMSLIVDMVSCLCL